MTYKNTTPDIVENPLMPPIYLMKLHETQTISEGFLVTRVAGGWIYEIQKPVVNLLEIVFVPFNNEFMPV
jgi:hypothetical protein